MKTLINILLDFFIIGLFLYSKVYSYRDKLDKNKRKVFEVVILILCIVPLHNLLKKIFKPVQVGQGFFIDIAQFILLLLFLLLLNFL